MGPAARLAKLRNARAPKLKRIRTPLPKSRHRRNYEVLRRLRVWDTPMLHLLRDSRGPSLSRRGGVVVERSPIFCPCATLSNYVGYVRKAC